MEIVKSSQAKCDLLETFAQFTNQQNPRTIHIIKQNQDTLILSIDLNGQYPTEQIEVIHD